MLLIAAIITAGALFYSWTQTRYYVGTDEDSVVIYQGIQQSIGPITLSEPHEDTGIMLVDLPSAWQIRAEETIPANSLEHAEQIADNLRSRAKEAGGDT